MRVPTDVLRSPAYRNLSLKAKALILDMGVHFNGYNNGHLSAAWGLMRQQGWVSKQTLQNALEELLAAGIVELTRQGGRHQCSLYAFTWMPIEKGPGHVWLDVLPTKVASGAWRKFPSDHLADSLPRSSGHGNPSIGAETQ